MTKSSIKAAVTKNYQYIHLRATPALRFRRTFGYRAAYRVKPQVGWQYAAGYFRNFSNNMFETSIEIYYKTMQNQIEYKEGIHQTRYKIRKRVLCLEGMELRAELFVNKVKGRLTGWVGYTLSWTWRKFPDLNGGEKYPANTIDATIFLLFRHTSLRRNGSLQCLFWYRQRHLAA